MSNTLEFFVKMRDMMSGGLAKLGQNAQQAFTNVQASAQAATGKAKSFAVEMREGFRTALMGSRYLPRSIDEIKNRLEEVNKTRFGTVLKSEFREATREAKSLQRELDKLQGRAGSSKSGGGGGGSLLGSIIKGNLITGLIQKGVGFAGSLIGQAIQGGAKQELNVTGFKTFLGEKGAQEAYSNIRKDAKVVPFDTDLIVKGNNELISAGVSAKNARVDILALANAVSAAGRGNDEFQRMSVNMQQIKTVGKASSMDIKQFGMAGINIYEMLSKATGKSVDQVKEMDVSYDLLSYSLRKAAAEGGMYAGALEKHGDTTAGKMEIFQNSFKQGLADIGIALQPLILKILEIGTTLMDKVLPKIISGIQPVVDFLMSLPIGDIVGDLFSSIGTMAAALAPVFDALRPLIMSVFETLWPLIMQVKDFTVHLVQRLAPTLTNIAHIASAVLGPAFKIVGAVVSWLIEMVGKVIDFITPLLEKVSKFLSWVADGIGKLLGGGKKPTSLTATEDAAPKGNGLSDMFKDLGKPGAAGAGGADDKAARGIASGGPRIININGVKFTDKIELNTVNMREGINELQGMLEEMFLRILNSGAAVQ
jgi:tape measure domain-containing protein